MAVDRRDLAHAIRFAMRISRKASLPPLRCCAFTKDQLVATDLELSLRAYLPGARPLGVLVPLEALKRVLGGTPGKEVSIRRLPARDGKPFSVDVSGAVIPGEDPDGFPNVENLLPREAPLAEAITRSLEPVLTAAATDDQGRRGLESVFFQLCRNVATGSNGHRLHRIPVESSHRGDFLVPKRAIEIVEGIRKAERGSVVRVRFHERIVIFLVGPYSLSARLLEERYPACDEVIPKAVRHELRVDRRALLEGLDRIGAVLGGRFRGVRLKRVREGLELHGKSLEVGELTLVVPASGWEFDRSLGVNLTYLHDAVRFASADDVTIGINDAASAFRIVDGDYLAVVMPMRLEEAKP